MSSTLTAAREHLAVHALVFPGLIVEPGIVAAIHAAAERHHVPPALLAATCLLESGLRADAPALCGVRSRGRGWLPAAMQPDAAAHALARWRGACGSWSGALAYFHTGVDCTPRPCPAHRHRGTYGVLVLSVAGRVARATGGDR